MTHQAKRENNRKGYFLFFGDSAVRLQAIVLARIDLGPEDNRGCGGWERELLREGHLHRPTVML